MARPIPRRLLIHSIVYKPVASSDGWTSSPGVPVAIDHVRIDPSSQLITAKDGRQLTLKSLLFYDARGSSPGGIIFKDDDTVTFGGYDYKVVSLDQVYDEHRLHHWEVGLT